MPYRAPPVGRKQLQLAGPARTDIDEILAYVARESGLDTALTLADRIDTELNRRASVGHAGASREWLSPGLRLTVVAGFSVYFRVTPTETIIVRFLRGSRDASVIAFDADTDDGKSV